MKIEPVAWQVTDDGAATVSYINKTMAGAEVIRRMSRWPQVIYGIRPLYAIPEGYVLLPKEPTPEIVDWVMKLCNTQDEGFARSVYYGIYEAAKPRGDDEYI